MNLVMWDVIVKNGSKSAIHCPTRVLSEEVLKIVKEKTGRGFIREEDHWLSYKENTCYYPNIGDDARDYMQYSDLKWAEENDQVIFEAADLLLSEDLPISLSEVDIKSLFGME